MSASARRSPPRIISRSVAGGLGEHLPGRGQVVGAGPVGGSVDDRRELLVARSTPCDACWSLSTSGSARRASTARYSSSRPASRSITPSGYGLALTPITSAGSTSQPRGPGVTGWASRSGTATTSRDRRRHPGSAPSRRRRAGRRRRTAPGRGRCRPSTPRRAAGRRVEAVATHGTASRRFVQDAGGGLGQRGGTDQPAPAMSRWRKPLGARRFSGWGSAPARRWGTRLATTPASASTGARRRAASGRPRGRERPTPTSSRTGVGVGSTTAAPRARNLPDEHAVLDDGLGAPASTMSGPGRARGRLEGTGGSGSGARPTTGPRRATPPASGRKAALVGPAAGVSASATTFTARRPAGGPTPAPGRARPCSSASTQASPRARARRAGGPGRGGPGPACVADEGSELGCRGARRGAADRSGHAEG